jgi:hypothetical protein
MSINIPEGYRLKKSSDLWPLVHDIKVQGTAAITSELRSLYLTMAQGVKTDSEAFQVKLKKISEIYPDAKVAEYVTKLEISDRVISRMYRIATTSRKRHPFNFDVSVSFFQNKKHTYLIPYTDMLMGKVLSFLQNDQRLSDFSYLGSCDKPEGISAKEWSNRENVWADLMGTTGFTEDLRLDLCSWAMFYNVSPCYDLIRSAGTFQS